ncbi:MAG: hypothetical protein KJO49_00320 [Bacteroidia bacterium]|nr:hypothetical protein [Bacteroidia bacterium]MBT8268022.1 hypothetical protein [Bacteroidia bacterium]NNF82161.1 hypothetical protein [Flavobacteriaceae bacterium]NNK70360.1 hypothetical protein [Flavobacteriaceae bacterium]
MRTLIFTLGILFALSLTSCATRVQVRPANTTVVKVAPKHHKIVIVKGKRYYFWNGRHYRKTARGYVVVKV